MLLQLSKKDLVAWKGDDGAVEGINFLDSLGYNVGMIVVTRIITGHQNSIPEANYYTSHLLSRETLINSNPDFIDAFFVPKEFSLDPNDLKEGETVRYFDSNPGQLKIGNASENMSARHKSVCMYPLVLKTGNGRLGSIALFDSGAREWRPMVIKEAKVQRLFEENVVLDNHNIISNFQVLDGVKLIPFLI